MRPPERCPEDLITLQRAWQQTYAELAQGPGPGTTAQRRRLIHLSRNLCTHPYWAGSTGWRTGGVALRRAARTHLPEPAEGAAA
ncbi:hypothetical protein ABZ891_24860 [Streptomyces sp. NPDC047023]|uniref:hypothetical protein n=1 Tax=Streptomyces sp. NPDC047023 TaxID=3155139 RepID=UPI00340554FD